MEAQDNRAGFKSSGPTDARTIQKGIGRGYIRRARGGCSRRWGKGCCRSGGGGRRKRRRRSRSRSRSRSRQIKSENHSQRFGNKCIHEYMSV